MKIQLAYPFDGHAPDETVDVDEATARRLVRDGLARLPAVEEFDTVAALRAEAAARGVDLHGLRRRDEIEGALRAAAVDSAPSTTVATPTPGAEPEE